MVLNVAVIRSEGLSDIGQKAVNAQLETLTKDMLKDLHDALDRSDPLAVSKLAKAFPKNSPETGLGKLASFSDVQQLRDVPRALKEADFTFHTVMQKLCSYRKALHSLVYVTVIGLCLWFIMQLRGIALGISSQTHFSTSVVAASLSEVMAGTAELLAVVAAIYVFECVCAFRISKRTDLWRLFLSCSTAPSTVGEVPNMRGCLSSDVGSSRASGRAVRPLAETAQAAGPEPKQSSGHSQVVQDPWEKEQVASFNYSPRRIDHLTYRPRLQQAAPASASAVDVGGKPACASRFSKGR